MVADVLRQDGALDGPPAALPIALIAPGAPITGASSGKLSKGSLGGSAVLPVPPGIVASGSITAMKGGDVLPAARGVRGSMTRGTGGTRVSLDSAVNGYGHGVKSLV
jgi:hypothetical protein